MKVLEKILKRRAEIQKNIKNIDERIFFFEKGEHGNNSKFFVGCGNEANWHTSIYLEPDEFKKNILPILKEKLESFKTKLDHIDKRIEAAEFIFSEFEQ